ALPGQLRLPPASLLLPGDTAKVHISASTDHTAREIIADDTTAFAYTLPAAISGLEFTYPYRQLWVTWRDLPPYTQLELSTYSFIAPTQQRITATRSYLEATHEAYLSLYPLPPDYDPRFTPDVVGPYLRFFTALEIAPGVTRASEVDETVNFP